MARDFDAPPHNFSTCVPPPFDARVRSHRPPLCRPITTCQREVKAIPLISGADRAEISGSDCAEISGSDCADCDGSAGVREAIEARSATLRYLPKYSPDLNPIEMPFSKLKAYLRRAVERTIPRLRCRNGSFARNLTAHEASNYFMHAGYA